MRHAAQAQGQSSSRGAEQGQGAVQEDEAGNPGKKPGSLRELALNRLPDQRVGGGAPVRQVGVIRAEIPNP